MFTWFKKNATYLVPTLLVVSVVLFIPHTANAWCASAEGCMEDLLVAVLNLFGLVLSAAGLFLNMVVEYTIINMRGFIEGLTGINIAWTVLRDVANLLFIFILLFIGISTILGSWIQSSFTTKLIPKVLLAALLINFSLFFTKAIIDVSNIVTVEFYKATASLQAPETVSGGITINTGLAGAFMDGLKLSVVGQTSGSGNYMIFRAFMAIIFILIAAFVFFTIALMLLVRFVVLIFLMLTSPIAFLGDLLPQLKPHATAWWKQLSSQAMFAPIFMILILLVILVIRDPKFGELVATAKPAASTAEGFGSAMNDLVKIILQYCIAMFLLVMALVAAKQTAGKAGSAFVGWGQKLGGSAVLGGTAMLARNSLGRMGDQMAKSTIAGRIITSDSKWAKWTGAQRIAKGAVLSGEALRTSSFDARGIKAIGGQGLGSAGGKGGLVGMQKERSKEVEERNKLYAASVARGNQQKKVTELEKNRRRLQTEADRALGYADGPAHDRATAELEKVEAELRKEKDTLAEMSGGMAVSEARKDLAKATTALSETTKKEAEELAEQIEVQKKLVKAFEERLKQNEHDEEARKGKDQANERIKMLRASVAAKPDLQNYVNAKERVAETLKQGKAQQRAAELALGERLAASSYVSDRMASDALRKGKESTEESLAKELKKMLDEKTSSGGGAGGVKTSSAGKEGPKLVNPAGQPVDTQGNVAPKENPPLIIKP